MENTNQERIIPAPSELQTSEFRDALSRLLSDHTRHAASKTPDFILANFLMGCLAAFDQGIIARDDFLNLDSILVKTTEYTKGHPLYVPPAAVD